MTRIFQFPTGEEDDILIPTSNYVPPSKISEIQTEVWRTLNDALAKTPALHHSLLANFVFTLLESDNPAVLLAAQAALIRATLQTVNADLHNPNERRTRTQ